MHYGTVCAAAAAVILATTRWMDERTMQIERHLALHCCVQLQWYDSDKERQRTEEQKRDFLEIEEQRCETQKFLQSQIPLLRRPYFIFVPRRWGIYTCEFLFPQNETRTQPATDKWRQQLGRWKVVLTLPIPDQLLISPSSDLTLTCLLYTPRELVRPNWKSQCAVNNLPKLACVVEQWVSREITKCAKNLQQQKENGKSRLFSCSQRVCENRLRKNVVSVWMKF